MILAIAASLTLMVLSVPIFLVFGIGSSWIAVGHLNLPWTALIQVSFGAVTKHVLLAIPLFIFAGMAMLKGGVAERLVRLSMTLVGHVPGGLGVAMVLAMGFFAAFSGSILAAIMAVGTILMPKMVEAGYPRPFVVCLAATAALLEGLIPPSNAAIIFSALTQVPVSKTFAAGAFPGLVLMVLLMAFVVYRSRGLPRPARATAKERWRAFVASVPGLMTPVIILGGIYLGLLTPTESAAAASVWAVIIGFLIHRELTWRKLYEALEVTALTTAALFAIIAMATFMSVILTYTRLPQTLIVYFGDFGVTPLSFILMVGVICLILGTFLEVLPIFYLTVPVFLAAAVGFGIDVYHFYVVFIAFVGIGLLTPPVCVGLYASAAVIKEPPENAFREVPFFILVCLVYAGLMILFPPISTLLPSLLP